MKVSELIRELKRAGCSIQRHGSEHDIWYSPITGKTDAVPRHGSKELGKGLSRNLIKNLLGR
ncbi:type II toxin-antitoxin system HicA family toxin [Tannerella forsythia]|uniref:type II toxin-antitoxin system HicA family toxin n=1 Tax=Tannerella forsythia TaxID=28112 RepID=UPI000618C9B9|nr:type II toxin-antitoxin system HicA family toxin [Tannerella forsythia]BAR48149.1 toxin-antitoxin system, toxin component, HicA family [Tannerella forsythia 3313]